MLLSMPLITLCAAAMLAGVGAVLAFGRRVPATPVTFVAMAVACASGMTALDAGTLWFWGVAAMIAAGIDYLVPVRPTAACRAYSVGGALVGACVGLVAGTAAWVTVASAAGAMLGYIAFSRTPRGIAAGGMQWPALAAVALPAVVNFSMLMIIFAQLLR